MNASDRGLLRIVVWNCRMALGRKLDVLMGTDPDVAILPEAGSPSSLGSDLLRSHDLTYQWIGRSPNKGLGVLARARFELAPAATASHDLEWVLPLQVVGRMPFTLLAVWAMNQRASNKLPGGNTLRQVDRALETYRGLIRTGPTVVAGDFNNALYWDKPGRPEASGNFAVTAALLRSAGMVSAYHDTRELPFGNEPDPAIYWQTQKVDGRNYHIDYCFIPEAWAATATVTLGSFHEWVGSGLSDHVPIFVDIPTIAR
jgi:exodeoxyribonuclease III